MSPQKVNDSWNSLVAPSDTLYSWDPESTYIKSPPFFHSLVNPPGSSLVTHLRHCPLTVSLALLLASRGSCSPPGPS